MKVAMGSRAILREGYAYGKDRIPYSCILFKNRGYFLFAVGYMVGYVVG